MRILVAPDSFKGSLSSQRFCAIAKAVLLGIEPALEVDLCPMADGGEGTTEAIVSACGGRREYHTVTGPLGAPTRASVGFSADGRTAIVDLASASGLTLVESAERNPHLATTYGTGELLVHALESGAQRILLGIGGSATHDGGAGLLEALGCRFLDRKGHSIRRGAAGLASICRIDATALHPRLAAVSLDVACDVDHPLLGARGATAVFAPQKGAKPADLAALEQALSAFADRVEAHCGRICRDRPGAGAAGGTGFGLMSMLGVQLQPGFDLIAAATGLSARLRQHQYAWLITGEGRIDEQTLGGKLLQRLGRLAAATSTPTIAFGGSVALKASTLPPGISYVFPIVAGPCTLQEAMEQSEDLLAAAIERVMRLALRKGLR